MNAHRSQVGQTVDADCGGAAREETAIARACGRSISEYPISPRPARDIRMFKTCPVASPNRAVGYSRN